MNTYTIEYELPVQAPRFGSVSYAAKDAHDAVRRFSEEFPGADIRELRRDHVHEP